MSTQIHKTKLTDLKGIDRNTVVVGDCYTPLTSMDRFSKKKIHKATDIVNDTTGQFDLPDTFKINRELP